MSRWLPIAALVVACSSSPATSPTPPPSPPPASRPSPPPPPPEVTPQPPPASVASFLAAQASNSAPWTAAVVEGKLRRALSAADASELAARLGQHASYVNGDYGCVGNPVTYELSRNGATLAFVEDCGHMRLNGDDHAALFSPGMVAFLRRVRGER